jgi:hypothetical protein
MTTPAPALGDDLAELLQHQGCSVQVDRQNRCRWCLGGRDTSRMNQAADIPKRSSLFRQRLHGIALRHIDRSGAHREAGFVEYFGRGLRILEAQISQQNMLASADPSRDGLSDGSRSDDDNNLSHD